MTMPPPALLVSDVRRAPFRPGRRILRPPCREQLTLIGLTGTKGKTTTTYFIKNILDTALGHRTAVLSTVEMYTGGESTEAHPPRRKVWSCSSALPIPWPTASAT